MDSHMSAYGPTRRVAKTSQHDLAYLAGSPTPPYHGATSELGVFMPWLLTKMGDLPTGVSTTYLNTAYDLCGVINMSHKVGVLVTEFNCVVWT